LSQPRCNLGGALRPWRLYDAGPSVYSGILHSIDLVRAKSDKRIALPHRRFATDSMRTSSIRDARPDTAQMSLRLLEAIAGLVAESHAGRRVAVALDSDFERDLGLDSLARAEMLLRVGDVFGTALPDEALSEARSPSDLLSYLGHGAVKDVVAKTRVLPTEDAGVPVHARSLTEALDWHATRHPKRLHVLLYVDHGEPLEISYGLLRDAARCIAAGLLARGLQAKQVVALMLPTSLDYLASFMGVMLAGGIPLPIYPPTRLSQIEDHLRRHARILDNACTTLLITVPQAKTVAVLLRAAAPSLRDIVTADDLRRPAMPIAHRAAPNDIAFLQYTSGSTGDPKGVTLTHANLLANIRAMGEAAQVSARDVFVSWLPLYHDMGLIGAWLSPLYFGFPLVLMSPLAFLARPARWLQMLSRHHGTLSAAPNFAYELCAKKVHEEDLLGVDLSSWRFALNGAEPVSAATLDAFADRFAGHGFRRTSLMPSYGLAECSVGLAFPPLGRGPLIDRISRRRFAEARHAVPVPADETDADAIAVVACGRPIPGHAMRVVDETGSELPDRHVGRLQFRGPSATAGYYCNPEASARLLVGEWRETGDYAYLADGEVYLTGRTKDLIIRGGRNLYPYELEQAVSTLPGVRKGCVAVFGSPDPANGTERLVVLAETRETDAAVRERLRTRINELSADVIGTPADEVVLAPPYTVLKTSSGKIRRAASREIYEQGLIGAASRPVWQTMVRLAFTAAVQRLRFAWRAACTWAYGGYVWVLFGLFAAPLWCVVAVARQPGLGRKLGHWTARVFLRLAALKWRAGGLDRVPARAHVLVVNHASYLDAIYLVAALSPHLDYRFIAKREFLGHWLPRLFLQGIGTLFVERFDARRGVEDVGEMVAALERGENLIVFPEGTFSRETGLRPLRSGAFAAAARASAPVAAAGLRGVRAVLRDRSWLPRRGPVELEIGATLAATGTDWAAAIRLRDGARAEILHLCGEPDLGLH
jgi:1-acyl-sn-glycerol-3-phosphate acyltransferase